MVTITVCPSKGRLAIFRAAMNLGNIDVINIAQISLCSTPRCSYTSAWPFVYFFINSLIDCEVEVVECI